MFKFRLANLALLVVLLGSHRVCGQVQVGGPVGALPTGVQVTLNSTTISLNATTSVTAQLLMSDGSVNAIETQYCAWTSSNTAVATVFPATGSQVTQVRAVGAGSANITCTLPKFSSAATITVTAPPVFTTPLQSACNSPPAVVTAGTQGTAYTFQPVQNGGTAPFTWSISAGALPNGTSIAGSTGLISGTPSVAATFTATVQVVAANGTSSCQISITIAASGTCGPPTYPCTPSNITGAFALPASMPFSGLGAAHTTCPGTDCGADNTVNNDPEPIVNGNNSGIFHNPIIRATNSFSGCGNGASEFACPATKQNVGFGVSNSDMDEEHWNTDDTMYYIMDQTGGGIYFYNFDPVGASHKSNLIMAANNVASTTKIVAAGAWSRSQNHIWYSNQNATDTGRGPFIRSWDMSGTYPLTPTQIGDMSNNSLIFPQAYLSCQPINVPNASGYDGFQHFEQCFSSDGIQDHAIYVVDFHIDGSGNKIYKAYNTSNSTIISCTNASCTTTAAICQNCGTGITDPGFYKVHNIKTTYDGQYVVISPTGCTTTCYNGASQYFFETSTGKIYVACNATLTPPVGGTGNCSGHSTQQLLHWLNGFNNTQFAWKTMTSNTSARFPASGQPCPAGITDMHPGAQNTTGSTDDVPFYVSTSVDSGAENYANCMAGEYMLYWPPYTTTVTGGTIKRMGRLYMGPNSVTSCFASQQGLGSISQTGKFLLFTSNMNGTLGCQNGATSGCAVSNSTPACSFNTTQPRGDVFIAVLK